MIHFEHVTRTFGQKTAVDDASFTVNEGCITGFIGPNGAGKTTSIHMITGVLKPSEGTILLNGKNITTDPIEAKKQFVCVPDSPNLFSRLTGQEYISFMADIFQVPEQERKEREERLLDLFELKDAVNERMSTYSHGMRQKALIIAALVCDPDIWILDEPMTGLDPISSFHLKELMKEHAAKGKAVFFSTHVLEVAEKLCDKVILINQGKIVYEGTLQNLQQMHEGKTLEEIFLLVTGHE